jgi:hypothetical protein
MAARTLMAVTLPAKRPRLRRDRGLRYEKAFVTANDRMRA